MTNVSR